MGNFLKPLDSQSEEDQEREIASDLKISKWLQLKFSQKWRENDVTSTISKNRSLNIAYKIDKLGRSKMHRT